MRRQRRSRRGYSGKKPTIAPFVLAAVLAAAALLIELFVNAGIRFIALPLLALAVVCAVYGLSLRCEPGLGRAVRIVLLAVLAASLVFFAVLEGVIIAGSRTELKGEPQVVVVLGAQVKQSGPAALLRDRLETAAEYLKEHPELPVVVSGGQGRDEPTTEALAMRDYLAARGIEAERIWMEDESHNTSENLLNTRALLEGKGYDMDDTHLLVVSNGFHLTRVRMLAERYGLEISTLAAPATDLPAKVSSYVRELPAVVKSFLFD